MKRKYKFYTTAEKHFIERNYLVMTVGQMAVKLKRERTSLRRCMINMGLFIPEDEASTRMRFKTTKEKREAIMSNDRYQLFIAGVLVSEKLAVHNPISDWSKRYALKQKDYEIFIVKQSSIR